MRGLEGPNAHAYIRAMTECRLIGSVASLGLALALALPAMGQEVLPDPDSELPELPSGPLAEESPAPEGEIGTAPETERAERLDALYAELADPANPRWQQTEQAIWRVWSRSGSASMDLLLRRADKAVEAGDLDLALTFLNDLVRLAPDFAEGWNKRATVLFRQRKLGPAVADIRRVLALEPRHFGALTGLAVILEETGKEAGALRAWRRAQEVHPNLDRATEAIERLEPQVEGRSL